MDQIERILQAVPQLTAEHWQMIGRLFAPYLIYRRAGKDLEYICTRCGERWTTARKRTETHNDVVLRFGVHNSEAVCPCCGVTGKIKNSALLKSGSSIYQEERVALLIGTSPEEAWIVAGFADRRYNKAAHSVTPRFDHKHICRLTPGNFEAIHKRWGYNIYPDTWNECKKPREPFQPSMGSGGNYWFLIDRAAAEESFVRFAAWEQYCRREGRSEWRTRPVAYFSWYAIHPQIEMLVKMGFGNLVSPLIEAGRECKSIFDWNARKPWEFFRMSKPEFTVFRERAPKNLYYEVLRCLHSLDRRYRSIDTAIEVCEALSNHNGFETEFAVVCKKVKVAPQRALRYVQRKNQKDSIDRFITWRDYINAAVRLKYDLSNETVSLPKDLNHRHDLATAAAEYEEKQELHHRYDARILPALCKQYEYAADGFMIVVPRTMAEIISEGKRLEHCVGGYAERHMKGVTAILFLRDVRKPDNPLYTVEMNGVNLRQVHGLKNCGLRTPEARAFFDQWKSWVSAGSPRDKKTGAPLLPASQTVQKSA